MLPGRAETPTTANVAMALRTERNETMMLTVGSLHCKSPGSSLLLNVAVGKSRSCWIGYIISLKLWVDLEMISTEVEAETKWERFITWGPQLGVIGA
jgi:hypothetical protein